MTRDAAFPFSAGSLPAEVLWYVLTIRDGVAILTIDNPPVNALGAQSIPPLLSSLEAAERDPAVGATVIRGAHGTFSGGATWQAFAVIVPLCGLLVAWVLLTQSGTQRVPLGSLPGEPKVIGWLLFHDFLLPFEVTSVLVLVAIMGAVVLASQPEPVQAAKRGD